MRRTFDFVVLGGGSAGLAAARRAAACGAKTALVEPRHLGGTCVHRGCVPKKIMYSAAHSILEAEAASRAYGLPAPAADEAGGVVSIASLVAARNAHTARLGARFAYTLQAAGIAYFPAYASFAEQELAEVEGMRRSDADTLGLQAPAITLRLAPTGPQAGDMPETIEAAHVLIATGSRPHLPSLEQLPGVEHCITSDGVWQLTTLPRRIGIIGGGYIACEMASTLRAFGVTATMLVRKEEDSAMTECSGALSVFDADMRRAAVAGLKAHGVHVECQFDSSSVEKHLASGGAAGTDDKTGSTFYTVRGKDGREAGPFDTVLVATGRVPNTESLNLPAANIRTNDQGAIVVNDWSETSCSRVFAAGDVIGRMQLTPVAIAEGRYLADRLFGGVDTSRMDYAAVPSVVFLHPPIGMVGMTQHAAEDLYGVDRIQTFQSTFTALSDALDPSAPPKSIIKLVTARLTREEVDAKQAAAGRRLNANELLKVVGLHASGPGADELVQGFAVAIKMGASKADFDACVAVHPTMAEEAVVLDPWQPKCPAPPLPVAATGVHAAHEVSGKTAASGAGYDAAQAMPGVG